MNKGGRFRYTQRSLKTHKWATQAKEWPTHSSHQKIYKKAWEIRNQEECGGMKNGDSTREEEFWEGEALMSIREKYALQQKSHLCIA
jgi:hypothetical protein